MISMESNPSFLHHFRPLQIIQNNITADVEVIPIQKVNEAYERLSSADVKYRFSIDIASLKSQ